MKKIEKKIVPNYLTVEYLTEQYIVLQKSPTQIAEENNTYTNKVRRALIKFGFDMRDRGEAQSIALKTGRVQHPTKGKKQPKDTKDKIAKSLSDSIAKMPEKKKKEKAHKAKINWKNKTFEEKQDFAKRAVEGLHEAAKDGSKFEIFLREEIANAGFPLEFHKENLFSDNKMHVDIFIPSIKTVVEIDGPSHFLDIWGIDKLQKHQAKDLKKNGIVLAAKLNMLRVKNIHKSLSNFKMKEAAKKVIDALNHLKKTLSTKGQYMEIEV